MGQRGEVLKVLQCASSKVVEEGKGHGAWGMEKSYGLDLTEVYHGDHGVTIAPRPALF